MKTTIISSVSVMVLFALSGCSPQSSPLVVTPQLEAQAPAPAPTPWPEPPPVEMPVPPTLNKVEIKAPVWITQDGGEKQMEFNPQLDIVFVIDNSDSMRATETNLVNNIDDFAKSFMKTNPMIDYHVGVISTWDSSERFSKMKKDAYGMGDLRFLKDEKQMYGQRFLTRKDKPSLLASTLKIGVAALADGGPETEEFFSPLSAALDKTGRGATNEGFFRDDAQLVVIFLTDADDSTANISPEEMAKKLRDFKGGRSEKVSAYGALVRKSDADTYKDWGLRVTPKYHPECFDMSKKVPTRLAKCAGGFGPERIEQLIALANVGDANKIVAQHTMSIINKNFGSDLAKIGANITETTLQKDIVLHTQPALDRATGLPAMRVRYGTQEELSAGKGQLVPNARKGGWLYDPEAGQIHLAGDIDYSKLQHKEGSRFAVDMIPVLPE